MKRKPQFCSRGCLLIAAGAVLGLTTFAQGGDPCTNPDAIITVEILTDNYGSETTWQLVEQGVGVVASGGPYPNNTLITVDVDVCSTSCYDFTIFDSFGDGICCAYGNGFYNVYYEGNLVCSGGEFGSSETCFDIACEPPGPDSFLDIKPGSCPNSFNRKSNGVLPVALVGTDAFDVTQVDVSTLLLSRADGVGGAVAPNEGPPGPHSVLEDVTTPFAGETCECDELPADGIMDLSMKFRSNDVVEALELDDLPAGDLVELILIGELLDGTSFAVSDCIRLVPPGTPPGLLAVESNAPGVLIDVSPLDEQLDGGGFGTFDRTFPLGTMVTLKAPPTYQGWTLAGWKVGPVGFAHDGSSPIIPLGAITITVNTDCHWARPIYRYTHITNLQNGPSFQQP
jgi:hypothetical protein